MDRNASYFHSCRTVAVATIAALVSLVAWPVHAEDTWSCGLGAAVCAVQLTAQGCGRDDQVCYQSADVYQSGPGCACLKKCSASTECGASEMCFNDHCTQQVACNSNADCRDARCVDGTCRRFPAAGEACGDRWDCGSAAPDCLRGTCQTLLPGQCTIDKPCPSNACLPQRCDTAANQCVRTAAPLPCANIVNAQCVLSSTGAAQCMVPACASNADCSSSPCSGPRTCDTRTGYCSAATPPCGPDLVCQPVGLTSYVCLAQRASPGRILHEAETVKITRPDFTFDTGAINLNPGTPGPIPHGFALSGFLPSAALARSGPPDNVYLILGSSAHVILVDDSLAASGKSAKSRWTRDARSGVWTWKSNDRRTTIGSVTITPSARKDGDSRVEVRGRALVGSKVAFGAEQNYAASLWIEWAGPKPRTIRSDFAFPQCSKKKSASGGSIQCGSRASAP